jgi:acyl-CoA synthetase (AMP-forming)/AMP-acid ligase II
MRHGEADQPVESPYLVHHFLSQAAQARPDSPLLVHEGKHTSYGEVEAASNRLARALLEAGLARGDRVGLSARNSRFYVEGYYAILKAGGIAVPLNAGDDGAALARSLRSCEARMLIAGPRVEKAAGEAIAAGTSLELLVLENDKAVPGDLSGVRAVTCEDACPAQSAEPLAHPLLTDLDVASIIFTSGSTGTPLGATLSHLNIVSNTRSIVDYLNLTAQDRMLAVLPFHYVYGKSLLNTHAAAGATVVIENRFLYPNTALDTLENEDCTGLAGVPSTFAILVNRSNLAERELPALRYVTQAGGPMSPELTRRLMKAIPDKRIVIMYGATEASARLSYLDPGELPRKLGSIGKAIPNVELRVLREDGSEAEVGEVGEIVARGSNLMSGYWGNPEATAAVLDEHGYHTGDLARCDEEGFFYIEGRKRDFIKTGAHRVSALEIEHAIIELPEIHEVAVIGLPDEILGEKIKAFVVFREGFDADPVALEKTLKKKLAHKAPSEIEVRDDLPKSAAGKIMKQALRQE